MVSTDKGQDGTPGERAPVRIKKTRGPGHCDRRRVSNSRGPPAGNRGKVGSGSSEDSTGRGREAATGPNTDTQHCAVHLAMRGSEVLSAEQDSPCLPAQKPPLAHMGTLPSSPGLSPGHPNSSCPPHPPSQAAPRALNSLQGPASMGEASPQEPENGARALAWQVHTHDLARLFQNRYFSTKGNCSCGWRFTWKSRS